MLSKVNVFLKTLRIEKFIMLNKSSGILKAKIFTCASVAVLLSACGGGDNTGTAQAVSGIETQNSSADTVSTAAAHAGSITYLAESAVTSGNTVLSSASQGYVGTAFATHFWANNDSIKFTVTAAQAGEHDIAMRYQNPEDGERSLSLYLNGQKLRQTILPKQDDKSGWDVAVERVTLQAGANTIEYRREAQDTGGINLNSIDVSPATMTAAIAVISLTPIPATSRHLYVATTGSDSNPGTQSAPFKTIQRASQSAIPSTTVHVAPGTYAGGITTATSGSSSGRIYYVSDKKWGAKIVPSGTSQRAWTVTGNYVTVNGFDIDGANSTAWRIGVLTRSSNVSVENNHIHNIATRSADCTSTGGAGVVGDSYYGGLNITFDRNLVHNIGPTTACTYIHGIYLSTSGTISNNIVHRVGHGGIHLWHDANKVKIVNNTIFNTPKAIIVGTGQRYKLSTPGDYMTVANNIMVDNKYGIIEESDGKGYGSHNYYINNLYYRNTYNESIYAVNKPHVSGSITADPMFVSYQIGGGGDYHLRSGSPAISKGNATHAPVLDFDGKKRGTTSSDDRGAYEY